LCIQGGHAVRFHQAVTMMMHDAGIEAKEAAVREVAKLLPLPDSLASINTIRSDYALRQQVSFALFLFIFSLSVRSGAGSLFAVVLELD
jgi:hypothetical protein